MTGQDADKTPTDEASHDMLLALKARAEAAERGLILIKASAEGAGSLLLDVQQDCIAAVQRAEAAERERDTLRDERHLFVLDEGRRQLQARAEKAEANEREAAAQWKRLLENYASADARAEAAEKECDALKEALTEIAYLDSPQVRGLPRRKSIGEIARAALEAKP